jgi:hypothetical protein
MHLLVVAKSKAYGGSCDSPVEAGATVAASSEQVTSHKQQVPDRRGE